MFELENFRGARDVFRNLWEILEIFGWICVLVMRPMRDKGREKVRPEVFFPQSHTLTQAGFVSHNTAVYN